MIEFALVFPLLLVLAVSVFDYGYYLEHVNNITTVVRDGARYASQNSTNTGSPWNPACPARPYSSAGTYSCPATSYTTYDDRRRTTPPAARTRRLERGLSADGALERRDNLFISELERARS